MTPKAKQKHQTQKNIDVSKENQSKLTLEEAYAFLLEHYPPEPASEEETKEFKALLGLR